MTNDEAIKHLFHPKIVAHVKAEVAKADAPKVRKKATKWMLRYFQHYVKYITTNLTMDRFFEYDRKIVRLGAIVRIDPPDAEGVSLVKLIDGTEMHLPLPPRMKLRELLKDFMESLD